MLVQIIANSFKIKQKKVIVYLCLSLVYISEFYV